MLFLWDVKPCDPCKNWYFGGTSVPTRAHGVISKKAFFYLISTVNHSQLICCSSLHDSFHHEDGVDKFLRTSVFTRRTRRHIPEDSILHSHRHENLKSYVTCSTEGRRYYATVVECFHGYAHHSILSRFMVTNSSKARFSIGPSKCHIKKATESRISLSLRRSVFGVSQYLGSEWVSLRREPSQWEVSD
jgi:hypothetical protein